VRRIWNIEQLDSAGGFEPQRLGGEERERQPAGAAEELEGIFPGVIGERPAGGARHAPGGAKSQRDGILNRVDSGHIGSAPLYSAQRADAEVEEIKDVRAEVEEEPAARVLRGDSPGAFGGVGVGGGRRA